MHGKIKTGSEIIDKNSRDVDKLKVTGVASLLWQATRVLLVGSILGCPDMFSSLCCVGSCSQGMIVAEALLLCQVVSR